MSFHVDGVKKPNKRKGSKGTYRNFPRRENTTTSVPLPSNNAGPGSYVFSNNCSPNFKGNMVVGSGKNTSVKKQ